MKNLTQQEVDNAIQEVVKLPISEHRAYYIDELQSGEFGVSKEDEPIEKFNSLDEAIIFAETRVAEDKLEASQLIFD